MVKPTTRPSTSRRMNVARTPASPVRERPIRDRIETAPRYDSSAPAS
jgi:hypothetical protein